MDRRKFFSGVGTLAAAGAAAKFLVPEENSLTKQQAAAPAALHVQHAKAALAPAFGRLPGSGHWVLEGFDPPVYELAYKLGVSAYDRAEMVVLGYQAGAQPSFQSLNLTVTYRLAEAPNYAPFYAFRLGLGSDGQVQSSLPTRFDISVPDGGLLGWSYRFDAARFGSEAWGSAAYPLGGFGIGPGIHVIAGLSAETGLPPDLSQFTWTETPGVLKRIDGGPVDFDYLCLLLQPARG